MNRKSKILRFAAIVGVLVLALALPLVFAATTSNVRVQSAVRAQSVGAPDQGALTWTMGTDGSFSIDFTNGSGAGAINKVFVDDAATATTYDLDGSLTDPTGATISFTRIAYIRIVPGSANVAELDITGDFILTKYLQANGDTLANVSIPVKVDGHFEFSAPDATGVAVTASTGDQIVVTPSGVETYSIIILGS